MRRILAFLRAHETHAVVAWVVLTLGLGVAGLRDYLGEPRFGLSDLLYQSGHRGGRQLPGITDKTPWHQDVARGAPAAGTL